MIGNAVPVNLAKVVASQIMKDICEIDLSEKATKRWGEIATFAELQSNRISA